MFKLIFKNGEKIAEKSYCRECSQELNIKCGNCNTYATLSNEVLGL